VSGGVTLLVAIPFALQGYQFAGFAATDSAAATKTSAEATSVTLSVA
jgi:hypothetical protein